MTKSNANKKIHISKRSIFIISAFALIIIVVALYVCAQGGNSILSGVFSNLQSQVSPTPREKLNNSTSQIADGTSLKVPELGIVLVNIPSELSDLTYTFNAGQNGIKWVSFSSSSLSAVCQDYSIGGITRGEGKYSYNPHIDLTKQFNSFWISFDHVQGACITSDKQVSELWSIKVSALGTLLSNTDNIQAL